MTLGAPASSAPAAAAAAPLTVGQFVALTLETSPSVRTAEQAFKAADAAYRSQLSAAILPTLSFSAAATPYGYNPNNGYVFQTWRLNEHDVTYNTSLDLNVFNSFQDFQKTRASKKALASAERAFWTARQNQAFASVQAFYDLDTKLKLLDVARQNLSAQEDQYNDSQDLYRNGMKSLADLLKSETDWRSSQLRIVDAAADERRSRVTANVLIGRDGLADLALKSELQAGTTALPDVERDLAGALEARPEIAGARADLERAKIAVQQAAQQLFPTFKVDALWNHVDQASFGNVPPPAGPPNPNYSVGLALSLPFGFNVASQVYNLMQAKAQEKEAEQALEAAIRQARNDVYGAYISLDHDIQSYGLAVEKESIAQRTLDLVGSQYREGTADAIRMNQAQTDLLDAQVSRTQALYSIFTDRAQYQRAVGEQLW